MGCILGPIWECWNCSHVRIAAISCLHTVEVRHTAPSADAIYLNSVPCLIVCISSLSLVSSLPRLIYSVSHLVYVSPYLMTSLFNVSSSDIYSTLRPLSPYLNSYTAQAVSRFSVHFLVSSHVLQLVMR